MKALKPLGSRIISVEEAMRIAQGMPSQHTQVVKEGVLNFKGYDLVQHEYNALDEMCRNFFKKPVEDVLSIDGRDQNEYVGIREGHVYHLNLIKKDLLLVPQQLTQLSKLEILFLTDNKIRIIEQLEYIPSLRQVYLASNRIQNIRPLLKLDNLTTAVLTNNNYLNRSGPQLIKRLENKGVEVHYL